MQNRLEKYRMGFVIIRVRSNSVPDLLPHFDALLAAATSVRPGQIIYVDPARPNR